MAHAHHPDSHAHNHADHKGHHHGHSRWMVAAHATLHCSIGCVIGETLGLILGTTLGFTQITSMIVSTVLAYLSGFTLAIFPVMRGTGASLGEAISVVWIGEAVSIGVMEVVMNSIDYSMGGMRTGSILSGRFWLALAASILIGFAVAWPVNAWLIANKLKTHH